METVSIILASAAFFVAVVSLYVGNLRRADIEMHLPGRPYLGMNQERREEGPPVRAELNVPVVAINLGARPGVLTWLDVERTVTPLYTIEGCHPTNPNWRDGGAGAFPLLSGESHVMIVAVTMSFAEEAVDAWRGGRFRSSYVVFTYSFLKGRRLRPTSRTFKVQVHVDAISATLPEQPI
jgi:hypothetical protein